MPRIPPSDISYGCTPIPPMGEARHPHGGKGTISKGHRRHLQGAKVPPPSPIGGTYSKFRLSYRKKMIFRKKEVRMSFFSYLRRKYLQYVSSEKGNG